MIAYPVGKEMIMAYTPELSQYHSALLRRIAWGCQLPVTKTLESIFDHLETILDKSRICDACKDKSFCRVCAFNPARKGNFPENPLKKPEAALQ